MQNEYPLPSRRKQSLKKIASYAGLGLGSLVLLCFLTLVFFPDPFVNRFIKPRITNIFNESYPAYSLRIGEMNYSFFKSRFGFNSVALSKTDRTFSVTVDRFSISRITWMHLLWGHSLTPKDFANSAADVHNIVLNVPQSQYEVRCKRLRLSVPDSEMVANSIKYYSLEDDEQFFAKSGFRQTRFRFDVPQIEIAGLNVLELFHGNTYRAKSIRIDDVFADILVNMDKPYDKSSANPQMPNEILSSMKGVLTVGSVKITNGRLKYCERYAVKAEPGVITFDKVNVSISRIANHRSRPDTTVVHAEGVFMNSATMVLNMAIPLASTDFSLRYSGSLSTMDITQLNTFLEPAEHRRIKSGTLQSATYDISVNAGQATGALRVEYKDLSIAVLNKKTGSEKGIFNRISSLVGRIFVIRGTNLPNDKGLMKIGTIQYARVPDDYFLQCMWFALRTGVADVVGF